MDNFNNLENKFRRYKAHVSIAGTTQFHLRNPYVIAWWSAAFPGFGHLLLSKYLRGLVLFMWEVHRVVTAFFALIWTIIFIYFSKAFVSINLLMLGEIHKATTVLDKQWFLFLPSMWGFVECEDNRSDTVEDILWHHFAYGTARVQ